MEGKNTVTFMHVLVNKNKSKIFERVMHERIVSFTSLNDTIIPSQHVFYKDRFTALVEFTKIIYESMDRNKIIKGLFLHLSKI